ncbi:cache domain-containing protein [Desulfosediminicola flagellatus]|uniref:cache domain-containing protein n=1 Tax=Desulfosediminicola flagellatus TaxID=2569541 RepID=UPI00142F0A54|nr:cache domain-containing protein [Desulfosediminicola flagellatus]
MKRRYSESDSGRTENIFKKDFEEALQTIRFTNGRDYHFIVSSTGIEELYPMHSEYEGVNLNKTRDITGKHVILDKLETVTKHSEVFVEVYWPNTIIQDDKGSLHYSCIKPFQPLNWFIGTSKFLNTIAFETW